MHSSQVKKVLLIEDSSMIRLYIKNILLSKNITVLELSRAEGYLSALRLHPDIDLLLLDLTLPGLSGMEVLQAMKEDQETAWPPVIVLSSISDKNIIKKAFSLGARDYILKPGSKADILDRVEAVFQSARPQLFQGKYYELVESTKWLFNRCRQVHAVTVHQVEEISNECFYLINQTESIQLLISILNMKFTVHDYLYRHSIDVAILSGIIGRWLGCNQNRIAEVVTAGLLHDIGKTLIPEEILNKADVLEPSELELLKTHSSLAHQVLSGTKVSKDVLMAVKQHHERMDGSGYPEGLAGSAICLQARVLAVADVFSAMISQRSYNRPVTPFLVMRELRSELLARQVDPHICSVFLANLTNGLEGRVVCLPDAVEAKVRFVEQYGLMLQLPEGQYIEMTNELSIRKFK